MRLGLPDFVSNSYFPAIAAVELGFFKAEGLDMELEPIYPVPATFEALRDHKLDFAAASSHATLTKFPDWKGSQAAGRAGPAHVLVPGAAVRPGGRTG